MSTAADAGPDNPSRADSLALVAGALALDFANTASGRDGPRSIENLREPGDVVLWAVNAGVIDEATGGRVLAACAARAEGFATLLRDAVSLREVIHRIAVAIARGRAPAAEDLARLSARCAAALGRATLAMEEGGARWRWSVEEPVPETILGPIALSAVGVLREGEPKRLKQCPGEHCGWVFFDLTKNRSRRWCEMSVCGNRSKAKAHYRRARMLAEAVE